MTEGIYTVRFGNRESHIQLPLEVDADDGIRILTARGVEVVMWSEDELERSHNARGVAKEAVWLTFNDPKELLDKMAHHIVSQ